MIVSGLAEGIDTAVDEATIATGGRTIAVLGTPLNKTYPLKNFKLQQEIMYNHLAISQFPIGHVTQPKDFVVRNRTDGINFRCYNNCGGSRYKWFTTSRLGIS